jgi:hypothetical protein
MIDEYWLSLWLSCHFNEIILDSKSNQVFFNCKFFWLHFINFDFHIMKNFLLNNRFWFNFKFMIIIYLIFFIKHILKSDKSCYSSLIICWSILNLSMISNEMKMMFYFWKIWIKFIKSFMNYFRININFQVFIWKII